MRTEGVEIASVLSRAAEFTSERSGTRDTHLYFADLPREERHDMDHVARDLLLRPLVPAPPALNFRHSARRILILVGVRLAIPIHHGAAGVPPSGGASAALERRKVVEQRLDGGRARRVVAREEGRVRLGAGCEGRGVRRGVVRGAEGRRDEEGAEEGGCGVQVRGEAVGRAGSVSARRRKVTERAKRRRRTQRRGLERLAPR